MGNYFSSNNTTKKTKSYKNPITPVTKKHEKHEKTKKQEDTSFLSIGFEEKDQQTILSQDVNIALIEACAKGLIDECFKLIENGANTTHFVYEWKYGSANALHFALNQLQTNNNNNVNKWVKLCKTLITNGTKLNQLRFAGGDCLGRGTRRTVIDMLIDLPDNYNFEFLQLALIKNNLNFKESLNTSSHYNGGSAYACHEWYPIHTAIKLKKSNNKNKIIKLLLNNGADINKCAITESGWIGNGGGENIFPLHSACIQNDLNMVKLLLDTTNNKNTNKNNKSLIININIDTIYVENLRKPTNDNNSNNQTVWEYPWDSIAVEQTALHIAISKKNPKMTQLLIIHGINSNIDYIVRDRDFDQTIPSDVDGKKLENNNKQHCFGMNIFEYIDKVYKKESSKTLESMKNIVKMRFYPKLIEKYPKHRQEVIKIVFDFFPRDIGMILLNYVL